VKSDWKKNSILAFPGHAPPDSANFKIHSWLHGFKGPNPAYPRITIQNQSSADFKCTCHNVKERENGAAAMPDKSGRYAIPPTKVGADLPERGNRKMNNPHSWQIHCITKWGMWEEQHACVICGIST